MTFDTTGFQRAHLHAPRGNGHWAFIDARHAQKDGDVFTKNIFWAVGTYCDAKKAARAHFSVKNAQRAHSGAAPVSVVVVLS